MTDVERHAVVPDLALGGSDPGGEHVVKPQEPPCEVCIAAEEHGHTPPGLYHCDDCHRSWKGLGTAHCAVCHETFTSDTAFDLHLNADGCKDPASARRKNGIALYRLVERFGGPTWTMAPASVSPYASKKAG